jgi:uncharacterized protein YecE (DUF72 family)
MWNNVRRSVSVHIGASGWHYAHWRGPFYPMDIPKSSFLEYYCRYFRSVEINNSFYRLPAEKALAHWRDTVPEGFLFSAKASRFITHLKKLHDAQQPLSNFLERMSVLGPKAGPVLFQLPPRWRFDAHRLCAFLDVLPEGFRYAIECRDPSWLNDFVFERLSEHGVALCIYDFNGRLSPLVATADFVYIRLHGPDGPYRGQYSDEALERWSKAIRQWSDEGKDVYCYFDNDEAGYAPRNALRLIEMIAAVQAVDNQNR